jgi:hypothetical protein
MSRIYTEIRIAFKTEAEKATFELTLDTQVKILGLSSRGTYIKQLMALEAATGIIKRLGGKVR